MSNSRAYITLPKGYTAFMSGIATAGWMQQVVVNHETTGGQPISSCTFQGLATPMVVTAGGNGFVDQQAYVVTDDTDNTQFAIAFSAFDGQTTAKGEATPIVNYKKDVYKSFVADWVTTYIYRTEDGGDHDEHDTTFVVTVVKDTKDVAPDPHDFPSKGHLDLNPNTHCWDTNRGGNDGSLRPPF